MIKNILGHIGNTPLLKLKRINDTPDVDIYVKCEFLNPGGSIKDRMALRMIEEAEKMVCSAAYHQGRMSLQLWRWRRK